MSISESLILEYVSTMLSSIADCVALDTESITIYCWKLIENNSVVSESIFYELVVSESHSPELVVSESLSPKLVVSESLFPELVVSESLFPELVEPESLLPELEVPILFTEHPPFSDKEYWHVVEDLMWRRSSL